MTDLKTLRFSTQKAVDGVWFDWAGDIKLLIARANNPRFREAYARHLAPHVKESRAKTLDDATSLKIFKQAAAEALLIGWTNLVDNQVTVTYTPDKALEYLEDPGLDLYDFVLSASNSAQRYALEAQADSEKN